jgi:hypothetical protein
MQVAGHSSPRNRTTVPVRTTMRSRATGATVSAETYPDRLRELADADVFDGRRQHDRREDWRQREGDDDRCDLAVVIRCRVVGVLGGLEQPCRFVSVVTPRKYVFPSFLLTCSRRPVGEQ